MHPHQRLRLGLGAFCALLISAFWFTNHTLAQQNDLNAAIKAVVRIRGCNAGGCNVGLGSGVIIHPSGVILTANHVTLTDKDNPLSPHLEDFIIELTEDARQAPQARYRARLLAVKSEADLALLGIYWDENANRPLDDSTTVNLPTLTSADVNTVTVSERLHILGYPLAGGSTVNYTEAALGGFDENGTLLKVQVNLSEGNSGGPALISRNGRYEIAGLVIRGRGVRQEVGLIRSVDQLTALTWEPTARRVWAENVQVTVTGSGTEALLQISADIQALDFMNHQGRMLAYVFDASTQQSLPAGDGDLTHSANGQLVLRQEFSTQHMVDGLPQQILTLSLNQLNTPADRLVFRLVLWDAHETRLLWRDDQWRRPEQGASEVAIAPTPTSTLIPSPTTIPTPMATDTPTVMSAPTATDTPPSTNTPTPSATDTPLPTNTPTPNATATDVFKVASAAATAAVALNLDPADVRINPVDDAVYVRVPSGEFMMGSDNGESNEKPVHRVYVDEFWIMRTEVTNAQYKKCVAASVCVKPNNVSWDKPEQANYPVTHVDWQQASTYAQWVGGRLPTEAAWEKAACGTAGRTYPWGNDERTDPDQLLNYIGKVGHTTEVGIYPKGVSPYGALDMAGNVWEWTADWYAADYYANAPLQNPQGPATGDNRVVRGGSFNDALQHVRCAYRGWSAPDSRHHYSGFRVLASGS